MKEKELTRDEKDMIRDWCDGELEMEEKQFVNKDNHDDYKERVNIIKEKLK